MAADADRVAAAIDEQFAQIAAGNDAAAKRIDQTQTDPALAEIEHHLRQLRGEAATRLKESRTQLRTGTLLGLAGAAAAIVALLCLLAFFMRKAAKRQAEMIDDVRQSQKMEAVGKLAGGVAHDFNNLLTAISGYSELALARLDKRPDPELRADIEQVAKSSARAAELTRQLLALSRRQTLQPTVFDLNDAVVEMERLLTRLLGTHIAIETNLAATACSVRADQGQIEQVIMNLALNARDAMPGGGVLTLETAVVELTARAAREQPQAAAGEYVVLRVADNGFGMDPTIQQRAFEPFYTTKPLGEGTGLGLATVLGIVSQSGGHIVLESSVGMGTAVELFLPRVAPVASPDPVTRPARSGGSEQILLVEDEEVVRNFTHALLSREGYEVSTACDGAQALEVFRDHHFDLVITDMVMPQMSGRVLAERLVTDRPSLPIIFISGYAHDVGGGEVAPPDAYLQKPFSSEELSRAVRKSLDRAAEHPA